MPTDIEELGSLVRRLHVHFEVEPELELRDFVRVKVAVRVRLWGVHARGARALPGCAKCHEIVAMLRPVLEYAVGPEASGAVEPFHPALYDSRVVPDSDEVALTFRASSQGTAGDAAAALTEERWLKVVRARFRELGIPER